MVYLNSSARFLGWCCLNLQEVCTPELLQHVNNIAFETETRSLSISDAVRACKIFLRAREHPPLLFDTITSDHFLLWIASIRKDDETKYNAGTYSSHRSAFFNLFRDYEAVMSTHMETQLSRCFRGLKKTIAKETAQGEGKITVGKDALPVTLYCFLAKSLLQAGSREDVFAHTFMLLSWNLMCRSANTVSICYNHLEWHEDALGIYFSQMKNDQAGDRPRDARHVYANPLNPEVCPILSLGIYFLCLPLDTNQNFLFPGHSQYDRFRGILDNLLATSPVEMELKSRGLSSDDIGTHSFRKGSATYASSGSTSGPSSTAIHLRAGWTLGVIQDTYLRYQGAGDQYVGRTVVGLPIDKAEFAILPPHFIDRSPEFRQKLHPLMPKLPKKFKKLQFVIEMGIASVVYHADHLFETLPKNHVLFMSPLFIHKPTFDYLKSKVRCGMHSDSMVATGIPAHVNLLGSFKDVSEALQLIPRALNRLKTDLLKDIGQLLEDKAVAAYTVTAEGLEERIKKAINQTGLFEAVNLLKHPEQIVGKSPSNVNANFAEHTVHFFGGHYHRVPEKFRFPIVDIRTAWSLWCLGNDKLGYPPFKLLRPVDIADKNERKRLSDFGKLMAMLEQPLLQNKQLIPQPEPEEVQQMFDAAKSAIDLDLNAPNDRKRRKTQLAWTTVLKLQRQRQ